MEVDYASIGIMVFSTVIVTMVFTIVKHERTSQTFGSGVKN